MDLISLRCLICNSWTTYLSIISGGDGPSIEAFSIPLGSAVNGLTDCAAVAQGDHLTSLALPHRSRFVEMPIPITQSALIQAWWRSQQKTDRPSRRTVQAALWPGFAQQAVSALAIPGP